jgi:drug/metabolite transporter (DMT)-like permease
MKIIRKPGVPMASVNILLALFIWSSYGVVVKLSGIPVHLLIFYSCLTALFVQGTVLSAGNFGKELRSGRPLKYPLIIGVTLLVNTFSYFYAFQHTTVANAVLTHYTAPVIVAFLASLFLKEKITPLIVVAIALASLGLWIMMEGFSIEGDHMTGIVSGLISGFAYALLIIFARAFVRNFHPLVLSFFTNGVIVVLLLPFVGEIPVHSFWIFLLLGTLHSTAAPVLYYRGLRHMNANKAAILGYLEPVCAILFGMVLLNEIPREASIIGGVLIIFSGYLTLKEIDIKRAEA